MEILTSQPGMKYYDEPFNIRRSTVDRAGVFDNWESLMPDTCDPNHIVRYLNDLAANRYRHMNPPPLRPQHRILTDRIVFKIHELEHLIGTLATRCNAQVVYLLRHPTPTTLSRKVFPRLDLFFSSRFYRQLIGDGRALAEIERIGRDGSHLQRGTVSWCYENLVPLKHCDFDGLFVTYEELVLNPVRSCGLLLEYLQFADRDAMLRKFSEASANINMSSVETQAMMTSPDEHKRRIYLVEKWVDRVTRTEMTEVSEILELFGLDVYSGKDPLPRRYLHFEDTRRLLEDAVATAR
jgi:hypothetical protein